LSDNEAGLAEVNESLGIWNEPSTEAIS
jgi:hypothetical protein